MPGTSLVYTSSKHLRSAGIVQRLNQLRSTSTSVNNSLLHCGISFPASSRQKCIHTCYLDTGYCNETTLACCTTVSMAWSMENHVLPIVHYNILTYFAVDDIGYAFRLCRTHLSWMHPSLSLSDSLHLYICRPFLNTPNLETNLHSLQQVQQLTSEWQHQRPWKFQVWISPVRKGSNYVCSLTWIAKWSIIKWWWWWWRLISRTRGSILLGWLNIIKLFEPFSERGYTTEKGSITPAWADGEAHNPCFFSSERVASPTNTRLNQVGAKSKKLCRTIKTDGEQSNQLLCHLDCFAPVCCQS